MIRIHELSEAELPAFFVYLAEHLAENGAGGGIVFQPLSQSESVLTPEWEKIFSEGLKTPFGAPGWRKLWVAYGEDNTMLGHVDIRAQRQPHTLHRVLLGMGVHSGYRKQKIGESLVQFVITYCKNEPSLSWLDLEVMANNVPALRLYQKTGFREIGTTPDMFRIDGISYAYTSMSLFVGE